MHLEGRWDFRDSTLYKSAPNSSPQHCTELSTQMRDGVCLRADANWNRQSWGVDPGTKMRVKLRGVGRGEGEIGGWDSVIGITWSKVVNEEEDGRGNRGGCAAYLRSFVKVFKEISGSGVLDRGFYRWLGTGILGNISQKRTLTCTDCKLEGPLHLVTTN